MTGLVGRKSLDRAVSPTTGQVAYPNDPALEPGGGQQLLWKPGPGLRSLIGDLGGMNENPAARVPAAVRAD
jgi:hypothetical protein